MNLRFISQPARDLLGEEFLVHLRSPETFRFWAASAWIRRPALRRMEAELAAFSARAKPKDCRGLFGVDLGGTTREGLEAAAQLFGQTRVFHSTGNPIRTFHPKLYLFERSDSASLILGSSNFTTGGLWANFETDALIELDPNIDADAKILTDVRTWFERWWSDPNGSLPITAATIRSLELDPLIRLPREHEVRQILSPPTSKTGGTTGTRAFPKSVKGLRRIPKAPPRVDPVSEQEGPQISYLPGLPLEEIATPQNHDDLRVLVAEIPHDRWRQVGFNRKVTEDFFHVYANGDVLWVQGVSQKGAVLPPRQARLIYPSGSNQNHRIEFPEPDGRGDPRPDRAILVVLERSFRTFRYMNLRPRDSGYSMLKRELSTRSALGISRSSETRRVLMSYGDLKAAWPGRPPLQP